MKVAMVLVKKPYRSTRALKPFYVTERDARILQLVNKARMAGPEDFEAYEKEKVEKAKPQEQVVERQVAFVDEPKNEEQSIMEEPKTEDTVIEQAPVKRGRGRPRKVKVDDAEE